MAEQVFLENEDLEKGEELMVFLDNEVIAYSTSHSLSLDIDSSDVSSKMSGDWDDAMPGKVSWGIEVESLVSTTKGHLSETKLMHVATKRKPVTLEVSEVTKTVNDEGKKTFAKGKVRYKGLAIITKSQSKSANGEYETMSVSFKGCGALRGTDDHVLGSDEMDALLKTV